MGKRLGRAPFACPKSLLKLSVTGGFYLLRRQIVPLEAPTTTPAYPAFLARTSGQAHDEGEAEEANYQSVSNNQRDTYQICVLDLLLQPPLHRHPPSAYSLLPTAVPVNCPQNAHTM